MVAPTTGEKQMKLEVLRESRRNNRRIDRAAPGVRAMSPRFSRVMIMLWTDGPVTLK